jgi:hypothetical protein
MAKLLSGTRIYGTATVDTQLFVSGSTAATSTITGALQVIGGVGIGGNLYVGGVINATVTGLTSTATNIAGGTIGQLHYQTGPGATGFVSVGTAGQLLMSAGAAIPVYTNTASIYVSRAVLADTAKNLPGGLAGSVPYQTGAGVTTMLPIASTAGYIITAGASSIYWSSPGVLTAGQTDAVKITNDVATATPQYVTFVSTSTGYTGLKTAYASGLTYVPSTGNHGLNVAIPAAKLDVGGNVKISGITTVTNSTNATSAVTGALVVAGGVGVGSDVYIGGNLLTSNATFNLINTNATTVNFAGAGTTIGIGAASGTTTVKNNLTVVGNLTVQGTTTVVDSTVTNITDPILTLGGLANNAALTVDDNKDKGIAFKWFSGTAKTGFFGFDDSTGFFTFVPDATLASETISGTKGAVDAYIAGGTAQSLVYQSNPNVTAFLAAGTAGHLLQTNGVGSAPSWVPLSGTSAGSATTATNAINIQTVLQTASASYYPAFVSANNATAAYMPVYTTSSFSINPGTSVVSYSGLPLAATLSAQSIVARFNAATSNQDYLEISNVRGTAGADWTTAGMRIQQKVDSTWMGYMQFNGTAAGINSGGISFGVGTTTVNANTIAEKMRITGAGTVLISATAANANGILQVNGNLGMAPNSQIRQWSDADGGTLRFLGTQVVVGPTNSTGYGYAEAGLLVGVSNGDGQILLDTGRANTLASGWARFRVVNQTSGNSFIQLSKGTTSTFYAETSTGNVGIGIATPAAKLHLYNRVDAGGAPSTPEIRIEHRDINAVGTGGSDGGLLSFYNIQQNNTAWAADSVWGKINFWSSQPTSGVAELKSSIWAASDGVIGGATKNTYLAFGTSAGTAVLTERMRITANGGISFAANSTGVGTSGYILKSNGDAAPSWVNPSTVASASATNADNLATIQQTANAVYYPTFVNSNNAVAAYEAYYTTSNLSINPSTGAVNVGGVLTASNFVAGTTAAGTVRFDAGTVTGGTGNYSYIMRASNDTGVKLTMFLNSSTRSADGGVNTLTLRNDGGTLQLGAALHPLVLTSNGVTSNAGITITGALIATSKSFQITHPTKPGMKLQYGSLESPYHGVRLTGEGVISGDGVIVHLPDYIHGLCKQEGSQVQITNIRHGKVLWVDSIDVDNDYFVIGMDRGMFDKKEYKFYWSFTAVRKDVGDLVVEFEA